MWERFARSGRPFLRGLGVKNVWISGFLLTFDTKHAKTQSPDRFLKTFTHPRDILYDIMGLFVVYTI